MLRIILKGSKQNQSREIWRREMKPNGEFGEWVLLKVEPSWYSTSVEPSWYSIS